MFLPLLKQFFSRQQIRRRFNVVSVFPDRTSVIRLGSSILMEQHDEWAAANRLYISADSMAELYINSAVNSAKDNLTLPA